MLCQYEAIWFWAKCEMHSPGLFLNLVFGITALNAVFTVFMSYSAKMHCHCLKLYTVYSTVQCTLYWLSNK